MIFLVFKNVAAFNWKTQTNILGGSEKRGQVIVFYHAGMALVNLYE